MKLIAQGAEAKLYKNKDVLIKERVSKGYRIAEIDEKLRASRTKLEANLLREARRVGVSTPQVIDVSAFQIKMEFVDGKRVKESLNEKEGKQVRELGEKIGKAIALLHQYDIIHGDLTTSNMILTRRNRGFLQFEGPPDSSTKNKNDFEIYLIDFGLGFHSSRTEDKATDLYLLYHAIESTHWQILEMLWKIILNTYKENFSDSNKVIKTLSQIEKRGRYKERCD